MKFPPYYFLLILVCIAFSLGLRSQASSSLTMRFLDEKIQQNPNRFDKLQSIESELQQILSKPANFQPISIPVVVHLLYDNTEGYVSDAQIHSQIQVLNDAFDGTLGSQVSNWPQKAGDTGISFCLATNSPNNTTTTGIIRIDAASRSWSKREDLKLSIKGGSDAWPVSDYLNIWVTDLGGRVSSYAQFPGGKTYTDGIVIDYRYFGVQGSALPPFDQGLTLVKEVGHWLNIHQIFGLNSSDLDDFIADTPVSLPTQVGCDPIAQSYGTADMSVNFMVSSDSDCKLIFTIDQKNRMLALLSGKGARASLRNSQGCQHQASSKSLLSSEGKDTNSDLLVSDDIEINIYPNPVRDQVNVVINKEGFSLSLTNMQGQLLRQLELPIGTTQLRTTNLVPGAYSLTIYEEARAKIVRKIVIQR